MEQLTIDQRVLSLEQWTKDRDRNWLLSRNVIKQALAVWGLLILGQIIATVVLFCSLGLAGWIINALGGF